MGTSAHPLSAQRTAAWLPATLGLLVICAESTRIMGADHTLIWLSRLCTPLLHLPSAEVFQLNHLLRKCGHLFGYGTLGLIFMQGWLAVLSARTHRARSRLRRMAAAFAVASVALVAGIDELHQSFLPNRTACFSDVLLDTAGSLLLIGLFLWVSTLRRRRTLAHLLHARTLRPWQAGARPFRSTLAQQSR